MATVGGPTIAAPAVGSVLADRYELVRHIARGGMGDVYEAKDRQLQRRVAVKLFRGAAAVERARFEAEVVVLAALNHPGLVPVYDAGDHDGDAFVVLELVEGPTLRTRLAEEGPVAPTEVAELGAQLADALAYVHSCGVVHRDVTPSNVLCGADGRPRLADFGIARLVDTTRITATATTVGTAAYMAPEQVQGHDVTPAADVYALGLVLLELLTGRKGFTGSPQEVAVVRLTRSPDTETGVPGAWRDLLAAMTERAAPNRPSALEVRDRLQALLTTAAETTGAVAVPPVAATEPAAPAGSVFVPAPLPDLDSPTVAIADGTTVMPAALVPSDDVAEPDPAPVGSPARPGRRRGPLVVAVLVGVLVLIAAIAAAAGGGDDLDLRQVSSSTTTSAPVVTAPPSTTTTAAPAVTEPPPPAGKGEGKGKHGKKGGG